MYKIRPVTPDDTRGTRVKSHCLTQEDREGGSGGEHELQPEAIWQGHLSIYLDNIEKAFGLKECSIAQELMTRA